MHLSRASPSPESSASMLPAPAVTRPRPKSPVKMKAQSAHLPGHAPATPRPPAAPRSLHASRVSAALPTRGHPSTSARLEAFRSGGAHRLVRSGTAPTPSLPLPNTKRRPLAPRPTFFQHATAYCSPAQFLGTRHVQRRARNDATPTRSYDVRVRGRGKGPGRRRLENAGRVGGASSSKLKALGYGPGSLRLRRMKSWAAPSGRALSPWKPLVRWDLIAGRSLLPRFIDVSMV